MARQGLTDKEKSDILLDAWIGPRYRKSKFAMLGKAGTALFEMAKDSSDDFVYDGRSLYLHGVAAKDAGLILGTALAFKTVNVKAVHLSKLSDALDNFDGETTSALTEADVVIISGFFDKSVKECPLSERSRFRIEWFLNERYSMEKGMIVSGSSEVNLIGSWWSESIRAMLSDNYESMAFTKKTKGGTDL